jgi:hypothetical protein
MNIVKARIRLIENRLSILVVSFAQHLFCAANGDYAQGTIGDKDIPSPSSLGVVTIGSINKRWKRNVINITIMNTAIIIKIRTPTSFMT